MSHFLSDLAGSFKSLVSHKIEGGGSPKDLRQDVF